MFDFTAEEEEQEKLFEAEAKALKKDLFTCPVDREPVHAAVSKKNEGFLSASQVQYVCRAGNYKKNGLEYTGVLRMLRGILNTDYLWNTVRVKGGAYGCMCSFGKSGDAYIASYRDPNLGKTIEAYEGIVEYVAHFAGDERSMTQAVIGTVSEMDAPMNPAAKALRALSIYLTGQTAEQLQKERIRFWMRRRRISGRCRSHEGISGRRLPVCCRKYEEDRRGKRTLRDTGTAALKHAAARTKVRCSPMEHIHNGKLRREGFSC